MSKKVGRPTKYTEEIGNEICRLIAGGRSLTKTLEIMREGDFGTATPCYDTVYTWIHAKDDEAKAAFFRNYAQARADQGDWDADNIRDIADRIAESEDDETAKPLERAAKLYTWLAGKRKPKVYGNLTKLEHSGEGGEPLRIELIRGDPPPKREAKPDAD